MRLIDADELLEHFESCVTNGRPISNLYDLSEIISYVESMPTIDAVEVKRGRWEEHILDGIMGHRPTIIVCSECNCTTFAKFNYCPNCGAKMKDHADAD